MDGGEPRLVPPGLPPRVAVDSLSHAATGAGTRHIALFTPTLAYGGVERVVVNLSRDFSARGQRVDLVAADARGEFASEVPAAVRVIDLHAGRVLATLPRLLRYLRKERPEALISAMDHTNVVALWAKRFAGVPTRVIITSHCLPGVEVSASRRMRVKAMPFFMRHCYGRADALVAVSSAVADELAAITSVSRNRIRVIPNPVITAELFDRSRERVDHAWFQPGQVAVVLAAGRLVVAKGFRTLIEAFAHLRGKARLVILGEGPDRERLTALVRALGLTQDVDLPGFTLNPYAYMAKSSAFVLPSFYEAFGLVLVEALALGLPVVASDTPGAREILGGGRGRLVPVGDAEALARALAAALQDGVPDPPADLHKYEVGEVASRYLELVEDCLRR